VAGGFVGRPLAVFLFPLSPAPILRYTKGRFDVPSAVRGLGTDEQLYEIQKGARRLKRRSAAALSSPFPFAICVRCTKMRLTPVAWVGMRWDRVLRGTRSGASLPSFEVLLGARGKTIEEVRAPQDELDLFR